MRVRQRSAVAVVAAIAVFAPVVSACASRTVGARSLTTSDKPSPDTVHYGAGAPTPVLAATGFDTSLRAAGSNHLRYDCTSGHLDWTGNIYDHSYKKTARVARDQNVWLVTITYDDGMNRDVLGYDVRAAAHGGYCVTALHPLPQPRFPQPSSTSVSSPSASPT